MTPLARRRGLRIVVTAALAASAAVGAPMPARAESRETPHIDRVTDQLRRTAPAEEGRSWSVSTGNQFAPGDWLIQTPGCWGQDPCTTATGTGHMLATIEEDVAAAEHTVDFSMLNPLPTGDFKAALARGLRRSLEAGHDPTVRMLAGLYPFGTTVAQPFADFTLASVYQYVQDLIAQIGPQGARLKIVAARAWSNYLFSWNHAKILAVDSRTALVGGHNFWAGGYLQLRAPVHDLSAHVTGPAAADAERFLDREWAFVCSKAWNHAQVEMWRSPALSECPSQLAATPSAGPGGSTVLAVGDLGIDLDPAYRTDWWGAFFGSIGDPVSCFPFPDLMHHGGASYTAQNSEEEAVRALVASAQERLFISQQDLQLFCPLPKYDKALLDALGERVAAGVDVTLVISNPGATSEGGTPYSNSKSMGEITHLLWTFVRRHVADDDAARLAMCQHMRIAPIRFGPPDLWPSGRKIGNHAKAVAVDGDVVSIGSGNMYPSYVQEYRLVIEDPAVVAEWYEQYANPLWEWSRRVAVVDPDQGRCTI